MEKNFVVFLSPGTLVAETTQKLIDSWDVSVALKIAKTIKERYGATPYGFYFIKRARKDDELDSKEIKRSGIYYLGGKIKTLKDIEAEKDPRNDILISNMKCNGYKKVIENNNSWRWTQPLRKEDYVLEFTPEIEAKAKETNGQEKHTEK